MEKPTREEVIKAWKVLEDIMIFVDMRGLWNEPVPELMKLHEWLKNEFGFSEEDLKN